LQDAPSSARCEDRWLAKVDSRVATRPINTDSHLVSARVREGRIVLEKKREESEEREVYELDQSFNLSLNKSSSCRPAVIRVRSSI
jgi:hypothetical protein